jgi:hypothetical protein
LRAHLLDARFQLLKGTYVPASEIRVSGIKGSVFNLDPPTKSNAKLLLLKITPNKLYFDSDSVPL